MTDWSNGYESIAEAFIRARRHYIGPTVVRRWAKGLRAGASILDLCIGTACACAALIPAVRAGRIDPVAALRQH